MLYSEAQGQLLRRIFTQAGLLYHSKQSQSVADTEAVHSVSWAIQPNYELAVSTDSLISGVHFFPSLSPADLAYKSLAVNLSDLAAMAAWPRFLGLTLVLPEFNENWIKQFVDGWQQLNQHYDTYLVYLALQQGPLAVHVQVYGEVQAGLALRRGSASVGDLICVTGTLGDASYALHCLLNDDQVKQESVYFGHLLERLNRPSPRVSVGRILSSYASAGIDISDGLMADLGHICQQSNLGASIQLHKLPQSNAFNCLCPEADKADFLVARGDDYELCFTISKTHYEQMTQKTSLPVDITVIGTMKQQLGVQLFDGEREINVSGGYEHFKI